MGCNCGGKKKSFVKSVRQTTLSKPINILETPDQFLTQRQIRIKHRHFRILARQERIKKRNELQEKLRFANNSSGKVIQ